MIVFSFVVDANETLRNLIKDLRAKFVEKERKLTMDVSFLAKEIDRLGKLAQREDQSKIIKLQYDEKFKLLEESLLAAQSQIKQKDALYATERFSHFRLYQLSVEKIARVMETKLASVSKCLTIVDERCNSVIKLARSVSKSFY